MKLRRLPFTLALYRRMMRAVRPVAPYIFEIRLQRGKEDPQRLPERRGIPSLPRPYGPLIWVHGASVGEMVALLPLVHVLCQRGFPVLITSQTLTSAQVVAQRKPPQAVHQFLPMDTPSYIQAFLDHWQPSLALFGESELWPNLILTSRQRNIPLVLVNGRMSVRSFRRWGFARNTIRALLCRFDLILAQSADDAERFDALGAPRVISTGNLKYDTPPPPADAVRLQMFRSALHGRIVVLAASTHAGEEEVVMAAHQRLGQHVPRLLTILVPRHPERGPELQELAARNGLSASLRSRGQGLDASTHLYIADTIGEMGLFYRSSSVCFIGGSLIRHGGQNPIEPAKLGSAILHGPHVENFTEVYAALGRAGGAFMVHDAESLATSFARVLASPALQQEMSRAAETTVTHLGGALGRTLVALEPYLLQMHIEAQG